MRRNPFRCSTAAMNLLEKETTFQRSIKTKKTQRRLEPSPPAEITGRSICIGADLASRFIAPPDSQVVA
jgi:hypothetical protein